jgi:hypothetical protein
MSAEIILPACHHFNAEPALQAPKTSSAFQPRATVKRLTSPQTGESPVPLQNSVSILSARGRSAVLSVVCKFASTTRNAPDVQNIFSIGDLRVADYGSQARTLRREAASLFVGLGKPVTRFW